MSRFEGHGENDTRSQGAKRYTFIGALNRHGLATCGQTAKNQMFLDFFLRKFGDVTVFDTFKWKRSPLLMLRLLLHLLFVRDRTLILSISTGTAYLFSRILHLCPRKQGLYYFVLGGGMTETVEQKGYDIRYYRQYDRVFVQGKRMVEDLNRMGLNNVEYLSNCRTFDRMLLDRAPDTLAPEPSGKLRFVFLSRITREKGVDLVLQAAKRLNAEGLKDDYDVTFYGPVAKGYCDDFNAALRDLPNLKYKGVLNLKDRHGYEILSTYDMMLFPTFWQGEGFPGVVVDAFVAGLPVLASDWNLNSEVVEDAKTGYLIKAQDVEQLVDKMRYVLENRDDVVQMRKNCLERARGFHSDIVLDALPL